MIQFVVQIDGKVVVQFAVQVLEKVVQVVVYVVV